MFSSSTGNTKKVAELTKDRLISLNYDITVKNVLTAKNHDIEAADVLIVGTPVHGYILFGQRPTKEVMKFLNQQLPQNMNNKPTLCFATYLFFPAGALNAISRAIEKHNGEIIGKYSQRRSNKEQLVEMIVDCIKSLE